MDCKCQYILFSNVLDVKKWLNEDKLDFRVAQDTHGHTASGLLHC